MGSTGKSYSIRFATEADRPEVLALMTELLASEEGDLERRHTWLYEQNPHGRALTWVAIDDESGELAGCTSFFPRKMLARGRYVLGALGGDGYVRPRYRRRGIMQSMHARSREDMPAHGVEVMFGTPMPANVTPLKVAGSADVTTVARYVRPISARSFHLQSPRLDSLARLALIPRSSAYLDPVTINDTRVDDVWGEVKPELGVTTVRDSAFITWRFVTSPSQKQLAFVILEGSDPFATCALERFGDNLRIIDLAAPRKRWGQALRAIANYASGCTSLEFKATAAMASKYQLWRHGYLLRDTQPKPLNIVLPPFEPKRETYFDGTRWFFTWAETDRDHS